MKKDAPLGSPLFSDAKWQSLGCFWVSGDQLTIRVKGVSGVNSAVVFNPLQIAEASPTLYAYDANGNVTSATDALGNTTGYEYDNLNRKTKETLPAPDGTSPLTQPTTSYQYDNTGNLIAVTDPLGYTTQYAYDNLGRKIKQIDPPVIVGADQSTRVTPTTYYGYDANSNLVYVTDPLGSAPDTNGVPDRVYTTWYRYDKLNRQTAVIDALDTDPNCVAAPDDPTAAFVGTHPTTTVYDAVGNVQSVTDPKSYTTSYVYDRLNRVTSDTNSVGYTANYAYDAAGNLVKKTDRDNRVTNYTFERARAKDRRAVGRRRA